MSNKIYSTQQTQIVTVGDLTEMLGRLDPSIHVLVLGYEGRLNDIDRDPPIEQYNRNTNTSTWYYGNHERDEDGKYDCIVL